MEQQTRNRFRELRYWSDKHNCDCLRLSHIGTDMHERFVIIRLDTGSDERARRQQIAENQLSSAVRRGLPPGELELGFD